MDARKLLMDCYAEREQLDARIAWLVSKLGPHKRTPGKDRRTAQRRKTLHWTQRPENKAKLKKVVAKMTAKRLQKP